VVVVTWFGHHGGVRSIARGARPRARRVLAVAVAVLAVSSLTSCSSGGGDESTPKAQATAQATPTPDSTSVTRIARPCEHLHRTRAPVELHGRGDASLWGLILSPLPIRVGDEVKIVWRMTGSGSMRVRAVSPQGRVAPLAWGPDAHGGSTYHRPGEEWGVGYRFTAPGCWRLHAQRDDGEADAWLYVAA
jgi:hypothetical protein